MAILSITFHTDETKIEQWNGYVQNELIPQIKKIKKEYILSEVQTEMISEGKNTNLLIFCKDNEDRILFLEQHFPLISKNILHKFQENILIFKTFLNTIK